jgi:glycerate 2-kinase
MKIVIAPNAFKNALSADDAADSIAEGLTMSKLDAEFIKFPIGDGGDGTGYLLAKYFHAKRIDVAVQNPIGKVIPSGFYYVKKDKTAIIEMADASGLRLLSRDELDPLNATSFGTGQLIDAALNNDVRKIILCVGGTATVDGGVGALQALGVKFIDHNSNEIANLPASLTEVESLNLEAINARIKTVRIDVLCDVGNPLLGEHGAAKVFGPQKGATDKEVIQLEARLAKLENVLSRYGNKRVAEIKHGGAAGGIATTMNAIFGARLCYGIYYFLDTTGFDTAINDANLIITGEGMIDEQTLEGKGPYGVALRAKDRNIPVIAMTGRVGGHQQSSSIFKEVICINPDSSSDASVLKMTRERLIESSIDLGKKLIRESHI